MSTPTIRAERTPLLMVGHGDTIRGAMGGYAGVPLSEAVQTPIGYTEAVLLRKGTFAKFDM